jgi:putative Mg2+ transporter-C (MgtC) family protein
MFALIFYMMHFLDYNLKLEVLGEVNVYFAIGIKIITAVLLGSIIGIDREKKLKTAGVKTQILICLGATLYISIAQLNYMNFANGNFDPNRVAAQVVSGIGFLGAGTIIHSRGAIYGMTTAATIWVVAAMGVAIGYGYIFSATLFAITTLIVLNLIEPLMRILQPEKHFLIEVTGKNNLNIDIDRALGLFDFSIISKEVFTNDAQDKINVQLHLKGTYHEVKKLTQYLGSNRKVEQFTYNIIKEGNTTHEV